MPMRISATSSCRSGGQVNTRSRISLTSCFVILTSYHSPPKRTSGVSAIEFLLLSATRSLHLKSLDVGQGRKNPHPDQHHCEDADAADQHCRDGAEPGRHHAGAEIAKLIGGAGEQRVHRVDAAAHLVGRLD